MNLDSSGCSSSQELQLRASSCANASGTVASEKAVDRLISSAIKCYSSGGLLVENDETKEGNPVVFGMNTTESSCSDGGRRRCTPSSLPPSPGVSFKGNSDLVAVNGKREVNGKLLNGDIRCSPESAGKKRQRPQDVQEQNGWPQSMPLSKVNGNAQGTSSSSKTSSMSEKQITTGLAAKKAKAGTVSSTLRSSSKAKKQTAKGSGAGIGTTRHVIPLPPYVEPGDKLLIRAHLKVSPSDDTYRIQCFGVTCPHTVASLNTTAVTSSRGENLKDETRKLAVIIPGGSFHVHRSEIVRVERRGVSVDGAKEQEGSSEKNRAVEEGGSNDESIGDSSDDEESCSPPSSQLNKQMEGGGTRISSLGSRSSSVSRSTGSAPSTYLEMAHDALANLKDRNGSSIVAIQRYMSTQFSAKLEGKKNVGKHLMNALKLGVKTERFVRVRNSYKLNRVWVQKEKAAQKAKQAEKRRKEQTLLKRRRQERERDQKRREAEELGRKKEEEYKSTAQEQSQISKLELERKRAEEHRLKERKAEEARRARIRAERIRRRRFPMDDLALIEEDRDLELPNPPEGVSHRPDLPRAFVFGKSSGTILDGAVVAEILHIYHFLRGDVGYCRVARLANEDIAQKCPEFSVAHLARALSEVGCGNARRAKCVPPLLSHLFTMMLRVLLTVDEAASAVDGAGDGANGEGKEDMEPVGTVVDKACEGSALKEDLQDDLERLESCLTPSTWPEVLRHYMQLMDRVYLERYTGGLSDTSCVCDGIGGGVMSSRSGFGYDSYLGRPDGVLYRTVQKLAKVDAWHLNAEEISVLLRVLCDDVLSSRSYLSKEVAKRGEDLYELLKKKKAAEAHFRKTKLAYEGPKWPKKKSKTSTLDDGTKQQQQQLLPPVDKMEKGDEQGVKEEQVDKNDEKPKHISTVTKEEYEAAEIEKDNASENYEKGLRQHVQRTEPIGYDRNYNAVYCCSSDPGLILIESRDAKRSSQEGSVKSLFRKSEGRTTSMRLFGPCQSSQWLAIETQSLFDSYMSSLDRRGFRELALQDALKSLNIRKTLRDDLKRLNEANLARMELADVEKRLKSAREAVQAEDAHSRRSGRLTSQAQMELSKVEQEREAAQLDFEKKTEPPQPPNYRELTGLEVLIHHDNEKQKEYLKSNGVKGYVHRQTVPPRHCPGLDATQHLASSLWREGGVFEVLVTELLELELWCFNLAQWNREDIMRENWKTQLKESVAEWKELCVHDFGPANDGKKEEEADSDTPCRQNFHGKRSSKDNIALEEDQVAVTKVIEALKGPLFYLEARIYRLSGLEYEHACADEANENMSVSSSDSDAGVDPEVAWKKFIYKFNVIPTAKSGKIRDFMIRAIAAARSAGLDDVVRDMRGALKQYRTGAAGAAKAAALRVLEDHGGYEPPDGEEIDDDEDDDADTEVASFSQDDGSVGQDSDTSDSILSREALALMGSLRVYDDVDREDWISAVQRCKTIARFGALLQGFIQSAMPLLSQMQEDHELLMEAMNFWEKEEADKRREGTSRRSTRGVPKKRGPKKASKEKYNSATTVWVEWFPTDKLVWAKVAGDPWWPAHVCDVKDSKIASILDDLGRIIVCKVGEKNIHAVKNCEVRKFNSSNSNENLKNFDEDVVKKLSEGIEMAKRIRRGKGIVLAFQAKQNRDEREDLEKSKTS